MNKSSPLLAVVTLLLLMPGNAYAQADSYVEATLDTSGGLTGRVVLDGKVPAPLQLLITKDMEICGEGYRERKEIDTTEDAGLRNVVVFIEQIASGKPWSDMEPGDFINQEKCFFLPVVQVMRRGREIDIINSDSTLHNIHAYEMIGRARRSLFNISQPDMGPIAQMLDPGRGNRVSLECDSHDFMQGWIFMADHPYATVVDEAGFFELSGIPPGTYSLSAWHPRLGFSTQDVSVEPDVVSEFNFTFIVE